jgi:hypothetical protein
MKNVQDAVSQKYIRTARSIKTPKRTSTFKKKNN